MLALWKQGPDRDVGRSFRYQMVDAGVQGRTDRGLYEAYASSPPIF